MGPYGAYGLQLSYGIQKSVVSSKLNEEVGEPELLSPLGKYIVQVIFDDTLPTESKIKKVFKIFLQVTGVPLCILSTMHHLKIALSLQGFLGAITAVGVALDFGLLGAWGYLYLIEKLFAQHIPSRKQNSKPYETIRKVMRGAISILLGMSTRLPSAGVAFFLAPDMETWMRYLSFGLSIGLRSTTTSRSVYETIEYAEDKLEACFHTELKKKLALYKQNLIDLVENAEKGCLELSHEQRLEKFSSFYESRKGLEEKPSSINSEVYKINETSVDLEVIKIAEVRSPKVSKEKFLKLFKETLKFGKDYKKVEDPITDNLLYVPRWTAKALSIIPPTALIIQNIVLSELGLRYFLPSADFGIPRVVISTFSGLFFSWVGYKYSAISADDLVKDTMTFGCNKKPTTFNQKFIPLVDELSNLVFCVMSWLPRAEIIAVAKHFVDSKVWWGVLFMESNFWASFLLILNAMKALFQDGVLYASERQKFSPEMRDAAMLIRKLDKLKEIIVACRLPELVDLLNDIGEENLKEYLGNPNFSLAEIQKVLEEAVCEV